MTSILEELIELHGIESTLKGSANKRSNAPVIPLNEEDLGMLQKNIEKKRKHLFADLGKHFISSSTEDLRSEYPSFYEKMMRIISILGGDSYIFSVLPSQRPKNGIVGENGKSDPLHDLVSQTQNSEKTLDRMNIDHSSRNDWLWYLYSGLPMPPPTKHQRTVKDFFAFEGELRCFVEKMGEYSSNIQENIINILDQISVDVNIPQLGSTQENSSSAWYDFVEMIEDAIHFSNLKLVNFVYWGAYYLFNGNCGISSSELFYVPAVLDNKSLEVNLSISGSKISDRLLGLLRTDFLSHSIPEFSVGKLTRVLGFKNKNAAEQRERMPRFRIAKDKGVTSILDKLCAAIICRTNELDAEFKEIKAELNQSFQNVDETSLEAVQNQVNTIKYNFGLPMRSLASNTIAVRVDVIQTKRLSQLEAKLTKLRKSSLELYVSENVMFEEGCDSLASNRPDTSLASILNDFRREAGQKGRFDNGLDPEKYITRFVHQQKNEAYAPKTSSPSTSTGKREVPADCLENSVRTVASKPSDTPPAKDSRSSAKSAAPPETTVKPVSPAAPVSAPVAPSPAPSKNAPTPEASPVSATLKPETRGPHEIPREVDKLLEEYSFLSKEPVPGVYLEDVAFVTDKPLFRAAMNRLMAKQKNTTMCSREDIQFQEETVNKVVQDSALELKEKTLEMAKAYPFLPVRINHLLLGWLAPFLEEDPEVSRLLSMRHRLGQFSRTVSSVSKLEKDILKAAQRVASSFPPPVDQNRSSKSIVLLQNVLVISQPHNVSSSRQDSSTDRREADRSYDATFSASRTSTDGRPRSTAGTTASSSPAATFHSSTAYRPSSTQGTSSAAASSKNTPSFAAPVGSSRGTGALPSASKTVVISRTGPNAAEAKSAGSPAIAESSDRLGGRKGGEDRGTAPIPAQADGSTSKRLDQPSPAAGSPAAVKGTNATPRATPAAAPV